MLKKSDNFFFVGVKSVAINERIFYRFFDFHKFTSDEILSIDEHACKLFESVLDEVKPDFIVTKEPAFHHLEIFYELCRARGIKVLSYYISGGYQSDRCSSDFKKMYGKDAEYVNTNNVISLSKTMNSKFLEVA